MHTCMTGAEFLDDLDAECLRIFPGLHWIVTRLRQERRDLLLHLGHHRQIVIAKESLPGWPHLQDERLGTRRRDAVEQPGFVGQACPGRPRKRRDSGLRVAGARA